jgi:hypothetical protein
MRVYEFSKSKSANFADLNLPISALYLLGAPSTPEPVRDEILERAKMGRVKHEEVKEAITAAKATGAAPQLRKRTGADGRKQPRQPSSKSDDIGDVPPLNQAADFTDVVGSTGERSKAAVFAPPSNGADELTRLQQRVDTLEDEDQQQRIKILALESEVTELKARPTTLLDALGAAPAVAGTSIEAKLAQIQSALNFMIDDLAKLPIRRSWIPPSRPALRKGETLCWLQNCGDVSASTLSLGEAPASSSCLLMSSRRCGVRV